MSLESFQQKNLGHFWQFLGNLKLGSSWSMPDCVNAVTYMHAHAEERTDRNSAFCLLFLSSSAVAESPREACFVFDYWPTSFAKSQNCIFEPPCGARPQGQHESFI